MEASLVNNSVAIQDCLGKQNQVYTWFSDFGPNPSPRRLPLDSCRGDVEFGGFLVPVASLAVRCVPEFTCLNRVGGWERKQQKYTRGKVVGNSSHLFHKAAEQLSEGCQQLLVMFTLCARLGKSSILRTYII